VPAPQQQQILAGPLAVQQEILGNNTGTPHIECMQAAFLVPIIAGPSGW